MGNFEKFKKDVFSISSVWNNEKNVYFMQTRDGYSASYKPKHPESTEKDMIINTIDKSGAYLRGNYELIINIQNKYTALYFQDIEQLKNYFEGRGK